MQALANTTVLSHSGAVATQMALAVAVALPFVWSNSLYFALGSTSFWVIVTVGAATKLLCRQAALWKAVRCSHVCMTHNTGPKAGVLCLVF